MGETNCKNCGAALNEVIPYNVPKNSIWSDLISGGFHAAQAMIYVPRF